MIHAKIHNNNNTRNNCNNQQTNLNRKYDRHSHHRQADGTPDNAATSASVACEDSSSEVVVSNGVILVSPFRVVNNFFKG